MHTISRLLAVAALAAVAAPSRADIMHWFWEVEVNGEAVDAARPIPVRAGDQVDFELWGQFDPYGAGFAFAEYAIAMEDEFFRVAERVNVDPADGYGPNTILDEYGFNGEFVDIDGSGIPDYFDEIAAFQNPPAFNADFDPSNPIFFYRIGWELAQDPDHTISLRRADHLDGDFWTLVYESIWGRDRMYQNVSDTLVFVPAPASIALLGPLGAAVWYIGRMRR